MENEEKAESAILRRAIMPHAGGWPAAAAQSLLGISLAREDLARADELALKSSEGTLSDAEAEELDHYRHAGRLLEMLEARAKVSLREAGAA